MQVLESDVTSHSLLLLLQEAELLIAKKIHPQTIIAGWRKATQVARDALREAAVDHRYMNCLSH